MHLQLHCEDASRWSESWASAVDSKLPMEVEIRIRSSKGLYSRYTARCEPIGDGDGDGEKEAVCWLVICSEVSEPLPDDLSLRESKAFVRDLLNSLPEHIVVLDEHGVVCVVNESWGRFGCPQQNV